MRPVRVTGKSLMQRFPRVSGDAPDFDNARGRRAQFSPRERGCAAKAADQIRALEVFPA